LPHLEKYKAEKLAGGRLDGKEGGLSKRCVQYHLRILSEALKHAVRQGLVLRNVAELVDFPSPECNAMNTLRLEDLHRFFAASIETSYHLVYVTALFTGLRLGELLGLPWRNVHLDTKPPVINVVQSLYKRSGVCKMVPLKTSKSRREVELPPIMVALLYRHRTQQEADRILLGMPLNDTDLVFAHFDGSPLDPSTVSHTHAKVIDRAGLPHMRFHDLRHSFATILFHLDVHPKKVQEMLGHSSIAVTLDTYSHIVPGLREKAAERLESAIDKQALALLVGNATPEGDVRRMLETEDEVETGRNAEELSHSPLRN